MSAVVDQLALSEQEVHDLTGYVRPTKQIEMLKSLGIPARRRRDNSVLVLRMHLLHPVAQAANDAPKRKSAKR